MTNNSNGSSLPPLHYNPCGPSDKNGYTLAEARRFQRAAARKSSGNKAVLASGTVQAPASIVELARALKHDVDLIFEWVYSNIEFDPSYGIRRGALGCLVDGRGNSFDQSMLMVALLRESGYTASYMRGTLKLTPSQTNNLFNVDTSDASIVDRLVNTCGIPRDTIPAQPSTSPLQFLLMDHLFVKVNIAGTDYVFDPTLKMYAYTAASVDLATATAFNEANFVSSVEQGSTITTDFLKDFNSTNLGSALVTDSMNFVNHIRANLPTATVDDVLGGRSIVPVAIPVRMTSLPYLLPGSSPDEYMTDLPASFQSTLNVQFAGIDHTFDSDDIYGKRLTLFFNSSSQPILYLDGVQQAIGNTVTGFNTITFTVVHNGSFSGSFVSTASVLNQVRYLIANAWGSAGTGFIDVHKKRLAQNSFDGVTPFSEEQIGETLSVAWHTWAAEFSQNASLLDRLNNCHTSIKSIIGLVMYTNAPAPGFDLPGLRLNCLSLAADRSKEVPQIHQIGIHASMLESSVLQQIFGGDAVSTTRLLSLANSQGRKIFVATPSNWSTIRPQLSSYYQYELDFFETFFMFSGSTWKIYLPEWGSLSVGNWPGYGLLALRDDGAFASLIRGYLYGGSCTVPVPVTTGIDEAKKRKKAKKPGKSSEDPIDLFTGDFLFHRDDIVVGRKEANFPYALPFQRFYNSSRRLQNSGLGLGWSHNYQISATASTDALRGLAELSPIDGAAAIASFFVTANLMDAAPYADDKVLISVLTSYWLSERLNGNSVDVSLPEGVQSFIKLPDGTYAAPFNSGFALSLNGNYEFQGAQGETYNFDSLGNIASIVYPAGVTLTFSYDGSNRLSTITNGMDREFTLSYSSAGNLQSVSDGTGRSVEFTIDTNSNLTTVTNTLGKDTTFEYVQPGLLSKVYLPENPTVALTENLYDSLFRVKTQKDSLGHTWTYHFAGSRTEEIDPEGNSLVLYFNSLGKNVKEIDRAGQIRTREYDGLNRLTKEVEPELNAIQYAYDSKNNLLSKTWKPKPGSGLSDVVRSFTYDSTWNQVKTKTDALGNVTTFNYEGGTGRLLSIVRPTVDGQTPTVSFTYNSRGQVLSRTDETGIVTTYSYDSSDETLTGMVHDAGSGRLNLSVSMGYNSVGDVTSFTDARGNTETYEFNSERQLTKRTEPAPFSNETTWEYDFNGRLKNRNRATGDVGDPFQTLGYTYTLTSRVETITEPAGQVTELEYDTLNRLKKRTDAENRVWEFTYDSLSRLSTVKDPALVIADTRTYTANGRLESVEDARGGITSYEYDGFDRWKKTVFPDLSFEEATKDDNGNQLTFRNRRGETLINTFDELNRLKTRQPYGLPLQTLSYDLTGRVTKISTPTSGTDPASGDFEFFFDTAGRLNQQRLPNGDNVSYLLDENGNKTRLTWPDSYFAEFDYDNLNRLTDIKLDGSSAAAAHFDYDILSRRTKLTYQNGCTCDYSYEIDNDISSIEHTLNGSSASFNYGFNAVHQLIDQTVSEDNFLLEPSENRNTTYGAANELNQYSTVDSVSYVYDGNGCLVNDGSEYTYDSLKRLTTKGPPVTPLVKFFYDPLNRQRKQENSVTSTLYVYDGLRLIAEYEDNGNLRNRYVYGPRFDEPLVKVSEDGVLKFLHHDRAGSIIAQTDESGVIEHSYSYGPFGETPSLAGGIFGFTGQRYDEIDLGRYNYKSRYYAPELGRFVQPDPIGFSAGDMNLYAYVQNDPLNSIDPLGLFMQLIPKNDLPEPPPEPQPPLPPPQPEPTPGPHGEPDPAPRPKPPHEPSPGGDGGEKPGGDTGMHPSTNNNSGENDGDKDPPKEPPKDPPKDPTEHPDPSENNPKDPKPPTHQGPIESQPLDPSNLPPDLGDSNRTYGGESPYGPDSFVDSTWFNGIRPPLSGGKN